MVPFAKPGDVMIVVAYQPDNFRLAVVGLTGHELLVNGDRGALLAINHGRPFLLWRAEDDDDREGKYYINGRPWANLPVGTRVTLVAYQIKPAAHPL